MRRRAELTPVRRSVVGADRGNSGVRSGQAYDRRVTSRLAVSGMVVFTVLIFAYLREASPSKTITVGEPAFRSEAPGGGARGPLLVHPIELLLGME